ncbi:branched-chain amino acid ABC transporter permease [Litoreibacter sp.]|nr:branched-chain amino acid ABC transporter permease [Litoreibacter sp.]
MAKHQNIMAVSVVAILILGVGFLQSWNVALNILNLCLISSIMALGVNIQWGYAGLFNVGIMGFAALGGLAVTIVAMPPVQGTISAAGVGLWIGAALLVGILAATLAAFKFTQPGFIRKAAVTCIVAGGYVLLRIFFDPVTQVIENTDAASTGYLGGFGLPVLIAWPIGALLAGLAAWVIGKITLGLRSDYLAIATLGISEIIVAFLKHEDWLTRGVKNVVGIPRPVPYEVDLQASEAFQERAASIGADPALFASIIVKLCYAALFIAVLAVLVVLAERALRSPWGRMMRAIRDNEVSAKAMGKDVKMRHLQVFVVGSMIVGFAGAMLTTLDGQLTPSSYQPLRFTFLIWVMVIIGGSGNNWGSILGGFLIWFFWVEAEPLGQAFIDLVTSGMAGDSPLRAHLLNSAAHMRLITMGIILLLALQFRPKGLLPERRLSS